MVKIWQLTNYISPQVTTTGVSVLSRQAQGEYDCIEQRVRFLSQVEFAEAMGAGNVVSFRSNPGEWIPVPPGSIVENTWKFACGKR